MRITIFGSGFGLYGYLPALLQSCHVNVCLPIRYQAFLQKREDISSLINDIEWSDNHEAILTHCDGVIFALPPQYQYHLLKKCLEKRNLKYFFLEKPLACSPKLSAELLALLIASGKQFRIGYNFRYTDWGKTLLREPNKVENIIWQFKAHHYANNVQTWKRRHEEGGGALRFYGIHLIALLAEAGYCNVNFSKVETELPGETQSWVAALSNEHFSTCQLSVMTNDKQSSFMVKNNSQKVYADRDPFPAKVSSDNKLDKRIPYLINGLSSLFTEVEPYYEWYKKVNLLWQQAEDALS